MEWWSYQPLDGIKNAHVENSVTNLRLCSLLCIHSIIAVHEVLYHACLCTPFRLEPVIWELAPSRSGSVNDINDIAKSGLMPETLFGQCLTFFTKKYKKLTFRVMSLVSKAFIPESYCSRNLQL